MTQRPDGPESAAGAPRRGARLASALRSGLTSGLWAGAVSSAGSGILQASSQADFAAGMTRSVLLELRAAALFWLPVCVGLGIVLAAALTALAPGAVALRRRSGPVFYELGVAFVCAVPVWRVVFGPRKTEIFDALHFTGRFLGNGAALAVAMGPGSVAWWLLRRAAMPPKPRAGGVAGAGAAAGARRTARAGLSIAAACAPPVALGVALAAWPVAGPDRPNIVLISIDTLRADRLGLSGWPQGTSPHFDRLAAESVVFDDATSVAPWTLPAHMSLMTSLAPGEHSCVWWHSRLAPTALTLAEVLREGGWASAGFTGGGYLLPRFGFPQGFDVYEALEEFADPRGEKAVPRQAMAWLAGQSGRPFFLFVHTYRVHFPYLFDEFAGDAGRRFFPGGVTMPVVQAIQSGRRTLSEEERKAVSDWYDGGIRSVDAAFGELLDALAARPDWDRTIVVLLADHGEQFWEHLPKMCPEHGHSFHQEVLRVPLVMRLPGPRSGASWQGARRVGVPVSLLDVAPTILEAAGCPIPASFRGRSLLPLAAGIGTELSPPVPVFAEAAEFGPERKVVRDGSLKLIWAPDPTKLLRETDIGFVPPVALYDLASDRAERENLASARPEEVARLMRLLREHAESFRPPWERYSPRREVPLSNEERERLRTLGYLN